MANIFALNAERSTQKRKERPKRCKELVFQKGGSVKTALLVRNKGTGAEVAEPPFGKMNNFLFNKMTTEQLLEKVREFATNNYCSCEGRIHDPKNLMEKLLQECDKWENEANSQVFDKDKND